MDMQIFPRIDQVPMLPTTIRPAPALPPQYARQIAAASRLAPAEAYRGHTAILFHCARAPDVAEATTSVQELGPFDAVHAIALPIDDWEEFGTARSQQGEGLRHEAIQQIHRYGPSLIALLDHAAPDDPAAVRRQEAALERLREWGAGAPITAVRSDSAPWIDGVPERPLDLTG